MEIDTKTENKQEPFVPYTLEELDYFLLDDNVTKCWIGNVDNICDHLEANGLDVYFVLATEKKTTKATNGTSLVEYTNKIFRVINSVVSRAIIPAGEEVGLDVLESTAWFALPKIPKKLVKMVDDFFRLVYAQHGTESIVLLTYDEEIGGPEGWGVLIPDQENTSGDCDYKPESVTSDKPDHVSIVGSIHSHPDMSAFASGTDHSDQADFDGLHITYGWKDSVNFGATEYYAELQIQGTNFTLQPNQIFEGDKATEPDPLVKDWVTHVKKKISPHTGVYNNYTKTITGNNSSYNGGNSVVSSSGFGNYTSSGLNNKSFNLPKNAPNPTTNIIIARLLDVVGHEKICPFCATPLIDPDIDGRRCLACHQYLALPGETLKDINNIRQKNNLYAHELDADNIKFKPYKPIIIWERNEKSDTEFDYWYKPKGFTEKK